jgi:hypothetical protein
MRISSSRYVIASSPGSSSSTTTSSSKRLGAAESTTDDQHETSSSRFKNLAVALPITVPSAILQHPAQQQCCMVPGSQSTTELCSTMCQAFSKGALSAQCTLCRLLKLLLLALHPNSASLHCTRILLSTVHCAWLSQAPAKGSR